MAESLTIARPYAEAAFGLARETGTLQSWSDALERIAEIVASPEIGRLLGNPRLTEAKLAATIADAASPLTGEQRNFVQLLAQNDRLSVLSEIATQYEHLRHAFEGVLDVEIASAYPMDASQLAGVVDVLRHKFGKQINAEVTVNPELIGGVAIRVGDEVIDASVRGKLAQLASALMA